MKKVILPTLLAVLPVLPAFATEGTDDGPSIFGIFSQVLIFLANNWLVAIVLIPAVILVMFGFLAYGFAKKESFGATVVTIFLGITIAAITGVALYKTKDAVKAYAEKAASLSDEVIDF